ncbi:MAG: hypothetical protein AAB588_00935 [Patescibacteria group bacterium]
MSNYPKKGMTSSTLPPAGDISTTVMHGGMFSVSGPKPQAATTYAVTVQFSNKEDAFEFVEDLKMLQDPEAKASFVQADKESREGKAKPMDELYKKYGV